MNNFVKKALEKIEQLDTKQIVQVIENQEDFIETLEQALDSLPQGVILLDGKKRVEYINYTAKHLPPIKRIRNYEGFSVFDVIIDTNILDFLRNEFSSKKEEIDNEFNYQWGEEIRTFEVQVSPIMNKYELSDGHLVIFNDVTVSKRNETRLRRSENLASMTTMAAGVAHEIKNPLAAMGIHLQLLTKTFEKKGTLRYEDASRYIDVLSEEINRLNSIVVDFLFAVRPMDTQLKLCSLTKVLEDICNFVEPELNENSVKLVKKFASVPKVKLDVSLFKQVVLNIVKNALNAIEGSGTITMEVKLSGDNVRLSIKDDGLGMDEKTQSKIFEPYFTTKASGTGLGLTVVYKVVKEHKGDISVTSKKGKGTEFIITLPVPNSERLAIDSALQPVVVHKED